MDRFREFSRLNRTFKFLLLILVTISVSTLLFTNSKYNSNRLDLLDVDSKAIRGAYPSGNDYDFKQAPDETSITCRVKEGSQNEICGLVFILPEMNETNFSLKEFDSLRFKIKSDSTNETYNGRIRVFIKSFLDPTLEQPEQDNNFKYQAVRLGINGDIVVPLSRFKVETWWEEMNNVFFDLSYVDMSSVFSIEFFIEDMPIQTPGDYSISLAHVGLVGAMIDANLVYKFLLYTWLFFSIFCYVIFRVRDFRKIKKQAYYDTYSGLSNLAGFDEKYKKIVGRRAVFYRVRIINWNSLTRHFGLSMTNYLLKEVMNRNIRLYKNHFYISARLNNDELIFIKKGDPLSPEMEEKFIASFFSPVNVVGLGELCLDVKIGVSIENPLYEDNQFALERSEISIQAILHDKERLQVYSNDVSRKAEEKTYLEQQIKIALQKNAFYLLYMPIYSVSAGKIIGVEALLRCGLESLKQVSPEVYISVAEETGLIRDIDLMVIETALRDIDKYSFDDDFKLSINISAKELLDRSFVTNFKNMVARSSISFERLCLEVTETFLLDIDLACIKAIKDIRETGCKVSLDDFGTGYTSFQQLINFPVDEIKIDRTFISGIRNEKGYSVIVDSLISIATAYEYKVVAEGVEDQDTYQLLVDKGCDLIQGYYISKPVSLAEIFLLNEKVFNEKT